MIKEDRPIIKQDINILQECGSNEIFDVASELFLKKWSREQEFVKYFKKQWLDKNSGWFQGYAIGIPDHNNANEADNRYIKEGQDRKRLGIIQFMNHAETTLLHSWSSCRSIDSYSFKPFRTGKNFYHNFNLNSNLIILLNGT